MTSKMQEAAKSVINTPLLDIIESASNQLQRWWNHQQMTKPCILIHVLKDNHEQIPTLDNIEQFWTDVDFTINRHMTLIDNMNYYGQAVPFHFVDFGASAMPCALGSEPDYVSTETIWAHPRLNSIEQVLDVELEKNNFCYKTILDITRESVKRSYNHHMVTMYPLNGITDILAGLYGTENYLIDLVYKPQLVKKAMQHFKEIWINAFEEVWGIISQGGNPGGIGWAGVWAPGSTFPIQEDLSYMISPEMYKEYCLPHVCDMIDTMDYSLYHLDGVGALPHLETLLGIENLNAIQWVPGAGKEKLDQWYDLIKKIIDRGKSVQVFAQPDEVIELVDNVGPNGLLVTVLSANNEQAKAIIDHFEIN